MGLDLRWKYLGGLPAKHRMDHFLVVEFRDRLGGDENAISKNGNPIGNREDFAQLMRDIDDGNAGRTQMSYAIKKSRGLARVESRRRLIEDDDPCIPRQDFGDRNQLFVGTR